VQRRTRIRGFTLVELLVVIAIIGTLIALLLPAIQASREAARRMQCTNHLKQIGLALHGYHDAMNRLPNGSPSCCDHSNPEAWGGLWCTLILPYMEYRSLAKEIDYKKHAQDLPANVVQTIISTYVCPSDPAGSKPILSGRFARDNPAVARGLWYPGSMGPTSPDYCPFCPGGPLPLPGPSPAKPSYCCQGNNWGTLPGNGYDWGSGVGMFARYRLPVIRFKDVRDGLAHTIMNGESLPGQCSFLSAFSVNFNIAPTTIPLNTYETTDPGDVNWYRACGFKSMHRQGANFLLADGGVRFFADTIDYQLYNGLGTRAGKEPYSVP
jgi:prepilin-type N-terminal cleavage/methylation domain-containing protein